MIKGTFSRLVGTVAACTHRSLGIVAVLALALAMSPRTAAQDASPPAVHPQLQLMLDEGHTDVPDRLKGSWGGNQGKKRLDGQEALDLHLRTTATRDELDSIPGVHIRSLNDGRATATVLPRALGRLVGRSDISSISLPRPFRPNLQTSDKVSGISPLRSQSGGVWSGKTGDGVVVGVVDSGIDFDHPNFTDVAGNTRIAYLWDQTVDDATRFPAPWLYGTEWTASDIDAGLCTEVDEEDAFGHGTHVTGIAAGNGAAPDAAGNAYTYVGVAPEATIVFVKLDFLNSTGIVDGLNYIFDRADDLGLPAVINLSLGSVIGSHDGTAPEEEEIDTLVTAQDGRAVVVAAGNERDDDTHAEVATLPLVSVIGPSFDVPAYTANFGAGNDFVVLSGYYPSSDDLTVQLFSPNGDFYTQNLNTSISSSGCNAATTGVDGTVQICNNYRSNISMGTGDREILIQIWDDSSATPPADGTWEIALSGNTVAGDGIVDFWMFSSLGGSGTRAFFSTHVDSAKTVGMPATSPEAITVGAYSTKLCWDDSTGTSQTYAAPPTRDDISPFSSAGPTRDGRSKPDLAAPGMGIVSALADEVRAHLFAVGAGPFVVTDDYLLLQGTSQAAPMVTGAVALLLEEDPNYSNADLKGMLKGAADEDSFTVAYDEPIPFSSYLFRNFTFGAGKLDLGSWAYNDPYESNDLPARASSLISGESIEGFLETDSDKDFFKLEGLVAGDTVDIDLTSLPADYRLRLTQAFSSGACELWTKIPRATSDLAGAADESIAFTLAAPVTPRYIRVDSSLGAFDPADPYELQAVITRPEAAGFNNSLLSAQPLPFFKEFRIDGSVAFFDRDYYQIEAHSLRTITATVSIGFPFSLNVEILDDVGVLLSSGAGSASHATGISFPGFVPFARETYCVVGDGPFVFFAGYDLEITVLP